MNRLLLLGVYVLMLGVCPCSAPAAQNQPDRDPNQQHAKEPLKTLLAQLKYGDDNAKIAAMMALADLGSEAKEAMPDLLMAIISPNEDFRLNGAIALGKIGKAAVPELAKLLDSKQEDTRYYAIAALGWVGPDAKEIAPAVIKALADPSDGVRRKAAFALGRIAPDAKQGVPVLIQALDDKNEDVREAAMNAVSKFGADAVPALIEVLKAKKTPRSLEAARALAEIGGQAEGAIPTLKTWLYAADITWQSAAGQALGKIGKPAVRVLVEATKDSQESTRVNAVNALTAVGAEAVPDLVDALGNKHVDVRRLAAMHLAGQYVNDKMVVLGLAYSLKDEDEQVRLSCAQGLQNLGLMAKLAAPKLREALTDGNWNVRACAYYALAAMNENPNDFLVAKCKDKKLSLAERVNAGAVLLMVGNNTESLAVLQEGLKDTDLNVRMQAAFALTQSGRASKDGTKVFMEGLKSRSAGVRQQALQGLQNSGALGGDAAPALLDMMENDSDPNLKQQAMYALQQVGGDAKVMIPGLTKMLRDKDSNVRLAALQVVGRYGADSITLIVERLDDKDDNVKQNAVWMLQNVQGDLKPALKEIKALLKHKDAQVRASGVQLIARCGDSAAEDLVALLKDHDENVRWQTVNSLRNLQGGTKKLVQRLIDMAENEKDVKLRSFGVMAMAQLGPDTFGTLFGLLRKEKDDTVRAAGIQGLNGLGEGSKAAVPFLTEALKDKAVIVRSRAVTALGNMGRYGIETIPKLAEVMIKDTDDNVRMNAVEALANMQPEGMPALAGGLRDADGPVRHQILNKLQSFGYRGKDAVPGLIACLKDKSDNVRILACHVLEQFGKDATTAVEPLRGLLNDTNPHVRAVAQNAINALELQKN
jgi:HEAT repeat protein